MRRAGRLRDVGLSGFCSVVVLVLVAPALIVVPLSFTAVHSFAFPPPRWSTVNYRRVFEDPAWSDALWFTLKLGAIVTVASVVLGVLTAIALNRSGARLSGVVRVLVLSPLTIPITVVGIGIYAVYLRWRLTGTMLGFALAHTMLAFPFVVVTVSAALERFDHRLEDASASLGAGRLATLRLVTLPLLAPAIATGALLAFLTSFDELVTSIFLSSPFVRTLPVKIYESVTTDVDPIAAAVSSMILVVTLVALAAAFALQARRERRGA